MILKRVKLDHFISHEETDITFEYGINVITGSNGSGKTSILDAISFSLFNVHGRGKKDSLINSRAKKAEVLLEFKESGIEYATEWIIERSKAAYGSLFRIQNDGRTMQARGGERIISSEVGKILGIDSDLFLQSMYIRQGEIENLVTATPAVRKKLISKLLGVDDLEKAWSNMRDLIREYELQVANLEGEIKKIPDLKEKLEKNETQLRELESTLRSSKGNLGDIQLEINELQEEIKNLEGKKEQNDKLNSQLGIVKAEIGSMQIRLDEQKKNLEKAILASQKVEELKKDLANLPYLEKYVEFQSEKEKLQLEESHLRDELQHIEKLQRVLAENKENHSLYSKNERILSEKREQRKDFEGAAEALEKASKQLIKIEREREKVEQDLSKELDICTTLIGTEVTIQNLETTLETVLAENRKIKIRSENKVKENNKQIGAIEARIDDIEFKISQISEAEECPICKTKLSNSHIQNLQKEFDEEKQNANSQIETLREEGKRASTEKIEIEEKLNELLSIHPKKIKQTSERLSSLVEDITEEKEEIDQLETKKSKLEELDEEIETLGIKLEQIREDYQNYESAKRELSRLRSSEIIAKQLEPIESKLKELDISIKETVQKMGYVPDEAVVQLKELRKKKEEFDQNEPVAKEKPNLKKAVEETTEELSSKEANRDSLVSYIDSLLYHEDEHKQKKEALENKENDKVSLEKEIVVTETTIKNLNYEQSNIAEELEQLSEKKTEKDNTAKFVKTLTTIRAAFGKDGVQKLIRARARPSLEQITRDFFEKFNLEYSDIKIDDDYDITVIGSAGSKTLDQISGGERVALAIALRLAIARVLSEKVETIIMDEPTTHLDAERRKELVNILHSFFREGSRMIPQMLIITHHREIEDVADVIYNITKKEGYSTIALEDVE